MMMMTTGNSRDRSCFHRYQSLLFVAIQCMFFGSDELLENGGVRKMEAFGLAWFIRGQSGAFFLFSIMFCIPDSWRISVGLETDFFFLIRLSPTHLFTLCISFRLLYNFFNFSLLLNTNKSFLIVKKRYVSKEFVYSLLDPVAIG